MITVASPITAASSVQERITHRAFVQAMTMIHLANDRKEKRPGDPKVGGHPASCASSMHLLAALHLEVREPEDFVCCKPHASPVDHALHHVLGLFKHNAKVDAFAAEQQEGWFTDEEAERAMSTLRKFPTDETPHVFQSYHAASDPDNDHFLPSGTVGIPPVCSGYLALAHRYANDHGWEVPKNAHFWSLIGDSEFREGSLLEAMPDFAERMLGNVTWIIDYNRQNLDGTRIPNERGLESSDCDRIERTALANGWKVIQLRHGSFRDEVFSRTGGKALQKVLEGGLSDYEFQMLALKRDAGHVRNTWIEKDSKVKKLANSLSDDEVIQVMLDLGGHDYAKVAEALRASRAESGEPYLLIAHTLKGWGLDCLAHPGNHSALPSQKEIDSLIESVGLNGERPFQRFDEDSEEGLFIQTRQELFRKARVEHEALIERNRAWMSEASAEFGEIPDSLEIDMSLFPLAHTQWMWGQIAAKLVRIGSHDIDTAEGRRELKDLTDHERRWAAPAQFVMTLSPDVGSSTNISPSMDDRIYGEGLESQRDMTNELELNVRHPELLSRTDAWTRHIRFEIAEANAMSALGSFGMMGQLVGLPFVPIMTVYDFFIKRALDQLYYDAYWGSEFILMGTPSGVTLSPEGAQHSWKSDIQIPNLITWEPAFAIEMDWVLSDAIKRQMTGNNKGRSGVLVRGVTRGIPQKFMLERLRTNASYEGMDNAAIMAQVREHCLEGGWTLIEGRGQQGYEPGDNVVHLFAMGSLVTEAIEASDALLERGIFANVHVVSSPELLLGILGEESEYRHLRETLGVTGDLYVTDSAGDSEASLIGLAGRRVPCVAVCDGEAGLLDNIGSIVGVRCKTLAVRKFSKCGRPDEIFEYQHLDANSIFEACGQVLSETALENFVVSQNMLERLAGRGPARVQNWRELWPERAGS
ncbi:MAG: pyruvate dehydrogenase E1 component [Planctomycetota bacterium]|jgi:pyruvate dehydrogenase E1 component